MLLIQKIVDLYQFTLVTTNVYIGNKILGYDFFAGV
jgi:hypothetical protein